MRKYLKTLGVDVSKWENATESLKEKLILERGSFCEVCGRPVMGPALELHHCLIHRMKGVKELNGPENLQLVCHECHTCGPANSWQNRQKFWNDQIARGYDMQAWMENLPLKIKIVFNVETGDLK